jgi:hypothetical protein
VLPSPSGQARRFWRLPGGEQGDEENQSADNEEEEGILSADDADGRGSKREGRKKRKRIYPQMTQMDTDRIKFEKFSDSSSVDEYLHLYHLWIASLPSAFICVICGQKS